VLDQLLRKERTRPAADATREANAATGHNQLISVWATTLWEEKTRFYVQLLVGVHPSGIRLKAIPK
jgi:hypothetical protein